MTERRAADLGPPGAERRKRGRPPIPDDQRQQTLHVRLPVAVHDKVCRRALRRGLTVNAVARMIIELEFSGDER